MLSDGTTQTVTGTGFNSASDTMHTYTTPVGQRFIGFRAQGYRDPATPDERKVNALLVLYGLCPCSSSCAIKLSLSTITTLSLNLIAGVT